ncbi:MAG: DUF4129 domain-containing protein [Anaerolineae bacterium]|nr:DUF4129 domain-containing protein [Anaerolineae bacterium]
MQTDDLTPPPDALDPAPAEALGVWQDPAWQSHLARPLLIAAQATALAAGPWTVVALIAPAAAWPAALGMAFLAALLGVYTAGWLRSPERRLVERTPFLLSEAVLIVAAARVVAWGVADAWPTAADLREWLLDPLAIVDGPFLVTALLALLAWDRGAAVAAIFHELQLHPDELLWAVQQRRGAWRERWPVERAHTDRSGLVEAYTAGWLWGGLLLLLSAGLARLRPAPGGLRVLTDLEFPWPLIVAAVVYVLVGLVLLSQARLGMLRGQWLVDGVEAAPELPGRWQRVSLVVVLGVGLLAALLPLGSTWRAGELLALLLGLVIRGLYLLVVLALAGLNLLLSALLGRPPEALPLPPPPEPAPPAELPLTPALNLPPWVGGAAVWLLVAAVVVYAAWLVLGREGLAVSRWSPGGLLRALWVRLAWALRSGQQRLARAWPRQGRGQRSPGPAEAAGPERPWRFLSLRSLSPRQRVRFYYLSALRRADEAGLPRPPSQTPYEFVQRLEATWPEAQADLEALTEAFVAARYDAADISAAQAQQAQSLWQRLRRVLRPPSPRSP